MNNTFGISPGHNPFGVDDGARLSLPRVGADANRWAGGHKPVGLKDTDSKCLRWGNASQAGADTNPRVEDLSH